MVDSDFNLSQLRFNGEETGIREVIQKCTPILEAYYDSIRPRPRTDPEKCSALQLELGKCWTPHPEDLKPNLELMFLTKRGNVYFPNEQRYF